MEEALNVEDEPDEELLIAQMAEQGDEDEDEITEQGQALRPCKVSWLLAEPLQRERQGRRTKKPGAISISENTGREDRHIDVPNVAECPQRGAASNTAEVGKDPTSSPETLSELPATAITLEETMQNMAVDHQEPDLISMQTLIMKGGQLEQLVEPTEFPVMNASIQTDQQPNRFMALCKRCGKLRDEPPTCERAFVADPAEVAILDAGASKTVFAKENFKRFAAQLAPGLRKHTKTVKSSAVFRFGNNRTLPSVFAACIPFGEGQWFRVEVVDGRTPFLLANAFLRKLKCQLDFIRGKLKIPKWQHEISLEVA